MKKLTFILLLTITFLLSTTSVSADMGPKRSIKFTIIGMEDLEYTFDLLSEDVDGNFIDPEEDPDPDGHYLGESYPNALYSFECNDGLSVWSKYGYPMPYIQITSETFNKQVYQENYHPPLEFKVLLYLEDGTSIVSELVSRQYFDSTMIWDVTDVDKNTSSEGQGIITGNIHIGPYEEITGWAKLGGVAIPRMAIRILITMTLEIGVLFLFRYRKRKSYGVVAATNAVTQILLTYLVARTALYGGFFSAVLVLLFLEAFIFILEGVIYGNLLKERGVKWALFYTFVANLVTLIAGFYLVIYL